MPQEEGDRKGIGRVNGVLQTPGRGGMSRLAGLSSSRTNP